MPLTLDHVHRYTRVPGTLEMRLVETVPYVRLRSGEAPPLFIQAGVVYDEGGTVVEPWPEWVVAAMEKLSPVVRAEVGLVLPGQPEARSESPGPLPPRATSSPAKRTWTCECGWTGSIHGKQFHRLNHHKAKKEAVGGDTTVDRSP